MKIIKNSSFVYACLVIIFTFFIFLNEKNLTAQANAHQVITLDQIQDNDQQEPLEAETKTPNNTESSVQFANALKLSRQGQTEQAILGYQQLLAQRPNHQMAAINLVILLKKTKGCDKLEALMLNAIEISRGKRKAKAHSLLASCLSDNKQYKLALTHLDKSLQFRPNHAGTWLKRARVQQKANFDYAQVLTSFEKALAMDEKNNLLRLEVARYQQKHLDFNESIKTIKAKYKSLKNSLAANKILAWNYLELGKSNNAKKHANQVQKLQSKHSLYTAAFNTYLDEDFSLALTQLTQIKNSSADFHLLKARIYQHKKWYKHSQTQLSKLNKYDSHVYRASWLKVNNEFLASISQPSKPINNETQVSKPSFKGFQEFLTLNIQTDHVALLTAQLANKQGAINQAMTFIQVAMESKQPLKKTQKLHVQLLWQQGKHSQAILKLQKINSHYPNSRSLKRLLANYLIEKKQDAQALTIYQQIPESNLTEKDLLKIAILQQAKQPEAAINSLTELLARNDRHLAARFKLALLLRDKGDIHQSDKHINLLLRLDKQYAPALKFLSKVN